MKLEGQGWDGKRCVLRQLVPRRSFKYRDKIAAPPARCGLSHQAVY
jgi:hypothetical protein